MLPSMFANAKRNLIIGVTAVAVLASATAPALAWGQREQDFTKGVLATLLVGGIILDAKNHQYSQPVRRAPVYRQPVYRQPVYRQPVYQQPVYYQPQPISIYSTAAAQAFNSYTTNERLRIQSTLTNYGYYHGRIDGSFGPGTYEAVNAYARRTGQVAQLVSRTGAYTVYDALLN